MAGPPGAALPMRAARLALAALLAAGVSVGAMAQAPSPVAPAANAVSAADAVRQRDAEIAECREGDLVTWGDGEDRPAALRPPRFVYRPEGAPAEMPPAVMQGLLGEALRAWSACGIGGELLPWQSGMEQRRDVVTVLWSEAESRGNFGLADLGRRRLALSPATFRLLRERNPRHDYRQTMQMAIAHEMGHFYGLMAHSRRCIDVTSYYHDGRGEQCYTRNPAGRNAFVEYRHVLPTACDIQRCRSVNGIDSSVRAPAR